MFTTSRRVAIATGAALALFATPLTALAEPASDATPTAEASTEAPAATPTAEASASEATPDPAPGSRSFRYRHLGPVQPDRCARTH